MATKRDPEPRKEQSEAPSDPNVFNPDDPTLDPRGQSIDPVALAGVVESYTYGDLNPIMRTSIENRQIDSRHTKYFDIAKDFALDSFSGDAIEHAGVIKGYVLYAWKETAETVWRPGVTSSGYTIEKEQLFVKARIPELHALPVPVALPLANNPADQSADWRAINLYPTFVAKDTSVGKLTLDLPQPGQVVYLDFEHRETQQGPLYLGPINVNLPFPAFDPSKLSAKNPFNQGPGQPLISLSNFETVDSEVKILAPNPPFKENRVRLGAFATLTSSSPLLVKVAGGALIHKLFAARLSALNQAWLAEGNKEPFRSSNGYRPGPESRYAWLKKPNSKRFKSFASKNNNATHLKAALASGEPDHYTLWEAMLKDEYNGDLRLGKIRRAWNSPHQTGLAIDFNNNGLSPMTKKISIADQQASKAYKWLVQNAHKFGINPYKKEPWHWECLIPRNSFVSGKEFTSGTYNVRVEEISKTKKQFTTSNSYFAANKFV